jgi:hypothetical protein
MVAERDPPWRCQAKLRACWATQAPVGCAVQPAKWTRRVRTSMKKSTKMVRSGAVSMVKKSQARTYCW